MTNSALRKAAESFWALPALLGLGAIVLAELMLFLDRHAVGDGVLFFSDLSATGSRSLLTTVGGSMLGVAATSFSITVSVLATTSSTYGPRLVRNFMADRGNQLVLAVLTSSFVYCLVVLRAVRSAADGSALFVPTVAVHVAVLIALLDVAVLLYFIHHIASSVQITSLQERVGRELDAAVDLLYPEAPADPEDPAATRGLAPDDERRASWAVLRADSSGYVQQIAITSLVRWARDADVVVEALVLPGDHVLRGDALARVSREVDERDGRRVVAAFELGSARSPHQDVEYAVQQLTEMAVRALSPGTNDPYTAIGALAALTPGLVAIASRACPPAGHRDEADRLRVVVRPRPAGEVVAPVFAAMRAWGHADTTVVVATLALARRLLDVSPPDSEVADAVVAQSAALVESYRAGSPHAVDAERVDAAALAIGLG